MSAPIKLIVGLGNPGPEYENTRHNAGAWFIQALAAQFDLSFSMETKFKGMVTRLQDGAADCRLLIPTTYMNLSGQATIAVAKFFKILPEEILVVHDELDFAPGEIRFKHGGGHGGHNGLRDIIAQLHSNDFYRLRVGIGHPGQRDDVTDYVLHKPSKSDESAILDAIDSALRVMPATLNGDIQGAMKELNTKVS